MSLKQRLLAIVLIACVLIGISIVGLSGLKMQEEPVDIIVDNTPKKETIYFWYSDEEMSDLIASAAVAFGEERDVRVIPVLVSASNYLETINEATMTETQMPDAYIIDNDALGKAYLAGLADEVEDTLGVLSDTHFPQSALSAVTYKDKLVAYPYYFETSALLYNKTYLQEWTAAQMAGESGEDVDVEFTDDAIVDPEDPNYEDTDGKLVISQAQLEAGIPTTLDELLAFADNYDAPDVVEAVLKWDVSDVFYNYYFAGAYMNVGGPNGDDKEQINIYNDETKQCLQIFQNLNQFFSIDADDVTMDGILQEFIEGKLVFTIVKPDAVEILETAKTEGTFTYDYGIIAMPKLSEQLDGSTMAVTNCVAINGYSKHKELANDFATFLTTMYLEKLYSRAGKLSACYGENQSNSNLNAFMTEYETSVSLPKLLETENFWLQLEITLAKVWSGEDIDTQLKALADQIALQLQ
ncbi:MAG: extracellular solute-binding protein [Lachnospiraceae bacterium]|nr:extracellular solute-binding protein [Lachnospiraceae bacterium]